jgi:cytoskeletal protein CcmA (bactofilin family)
MDVYSVMPDEPTPPSRAARFGTGESVAGTITIGPRDQLSGRLTYEGDVRIKGSFEGDLTLSGDLQIDGGGTVKARVECRNLSVRGSLEGEAVVGDRLLVAGAGSATGGFTVGRLVIEDGAVLNGTVTMDRAAPARSNGHGPA